MRYVPRRIQPTLLAAARRFPALILTGPRRSGKTTLLRRAFPGASYEQDLVRSAFLGPIFEGFVASEIVKRQVNAGRRREIYYFRDQQGLEVDFLVPIRGGRLLLLEAKASRTVRPDMAWSLVRLSAASRRRKVESVVVFRGPQAGSATTALRPGVRALPLSTMLDLID